MYGADTHHVAVNQGLDMKKWWVAFVDALPRRLVLLDVGARGGLQRPWSMLRRGVYQILVEPDPEEAAELKESLRPEDGQVVQHALWNDQVLLPLHLTATRRCSSVFRPNFRLLDQFPESDRFKVEGQVSLETRRVDDLVDSGLMRPPDFAKIDTQGADLAVLSGGRRTFSEGLVGLEVEVEFARLYEGQPLFTDIDKFVSTELGLELWDIRKTYWKYRGGEVLGGPKGRLVFGDALYFRPIDSLKTWFDSLGADAAREKLALLVMSACAYGYADFALAAVEVSQAANFLSSSEVERLKGVLHKYGRGFRPLANGHAALYIVLDTVARIFKPSHHGWASIGQDLGSRRRGAFWT